MVFTSLLVSSPARHGCFGSSVYLPSSLVFLVARPGPCSVLLATEIRLPMWQYSSNWAGAVWDTYPSVRYVAHSRLSPEPSPSQPPVPLTALRRPGLASMATQCGTAILQTGIDFTYNGGAVSYQAWYEWYPAFAHNFNLAINAGDVIKLTVTTTSTTSGSAVIENLTTGLQVSKQLSSSHALCEQNADVAFTNAYATTSTGSHITPNGATIIDIEQNNQVLTSVSENSNGVTITYQ
ncbi:concanavalin A-like lectin/glucanase domain-containing protein [Amanita rubescens]|nr:concanavalin A-like lectin/glucanase domain-containing protein [Amanita rubescens]